MLICADFPPLREDLSEKMFIDSKRWAAKMFFLDLANEDELILIMFSCTEAEKLVWADK